MKTLTTLVFLTVSLAASATLGQTASPTPVPAQTPSAFRPATQSIESLQSRIRLRLQSSDLRRGQVGVKIVSMSSGKIIYEENAEKYFMPASNMKNFTVATAIEKLTPDFKFITSVFAQAAPDSMAQLAAFEYSAAAMYRSRPRSFRQKEPTLTSRELTGLLNG
jgi:D-alanyl-D-alanine carboxypeptidase/D-alanyl-D-alanine-endopeptidase (penicillin-binding protein 4)